MITDAQKQKIIQVDKDTNAFVVTKGGHEVFQISFYRSIIRKFFTTNYGYILHFQCRSSIKIEKGNVCLVSPNGVVKWWAERKRHDDCYVELNVTNDNVVGYDGTYNCSIDIKTGKILQREFIK